MNTLDAEQVFTEYFVPVYQYIHYRVWHQQEAEDITADVFEKIALNLHSYKKQHGATLRSWIFTIVRNTLIDYYKKKKLNAVDIDTIAIPSDAKIEQQFDDANDLEQLFSAIEQLPEPQPEILLMRFKADMSNKEIASILKIPASTVSATISKSLSKLRTEFERS